MQYYKRRKMIAEVQTMKERAHNMEVELLRQKEEKNKKYTGRQRQQKQSKKKVISCSDRRKRETMTEVLPGKNRAQGVEIQERRIVIEENQNGGGLLNGKYQTRK